MKHRFLTLLHIVLLSYVMGTFLSLCAYYADDIDGVIYAASNRMLDVTASVGTHFDIAAAYISTSNPNLTSIYIVEGWRKEQIAEAFHKRLDWSETEKYSFAEMLQCTLETNEGKLLPAIYIVPKDAKPEDIKNIMMHRFESKLATTSIAISSSTPLNVDKVLIIASLIQREAAGKQDMSLISGIIWNRIMSDMTLDIDATLQYVKGNEEEWWPRVQSEDKFIDSPFNTYQNKGLPPHPIANPGLAAISAAFNPTETECLYYLHDRYGRIHCSASYEGHKRNINAYLR